MSTVETLPPTISVERAGQLLGISRRAAYRAVSRGQIPTLKVGRRLLVPTQRLLDLLGMSTPEDTTLRVAPRFAIEEEPEGSSPPRDSAQAHPVEHARTG